MKHIERRFLFKGVIVGAVIAALASIVAILSLQPKNILPESFFFGSSKSSTTYNQTATQITEVRDKTTIDGQLFIVLKTIVSNEGLYARILSMDNRDENCYSSDTYLSIWDKQGERLLQKRQFNAVLSDTTKCIQSFIWSEGQSISFSDNEGESYLYQIGTDQFVSI